MLQQYFIQKNDYRRFGYIMLNKLFMNKDVFYRRFMPFTISLALFMEAVDTTVINTAIPVMAKNLHVGPIDLKIALISYLMSLAIFIPISGWVADKFGVKRVFIAALGLFIFSSFWCGFATTLWELVLARTLQGVGGSLMTPVGRLIVARFFERHELINIMGRMVMVAAIGMMLGPAIGGYITYHFSWRWIFWINIPVGLFAMLMASFSIIDIKPQKVHKLDTMGFILFGLGLAGLSFSLSALSQSAINNAWVFFILCCATLSLILYAAHSRHKANPIVNTKLFQFRTFQISAMGNIFSRASFSGLPFLLPLFMQVGFGYSPQLSGLLLAPTAFGVLLIKPFSFSILQAMGYKRLLILNTLFIGLMLWSLIFINAETPIYYVGFFTFMYGLCMALQYTCMNSLAYAEIPIEYFSSSTSLMSTIQQVSLSFGVALAAFLLYFFSESNTHEHLKPSVFHDAFFGMGLLTILSLCIFIRLSPTDGQQMIRKEINQM